MKKACLLLTVCLLGGCASQTVSSSEETANDDITTPISQTDFSSADAENVFNMAVRNHCKLLDHVCTVEKVVVQNDDIYGTYTYDEEDTVYTVTGVLQNVSVSNSNNAFVTIGSKTFSSGIINTADEETNEEAAAEVSESGLPHFDLPSQLEEGTQSSSDWIYEEDAYKVLLLNIASGSMNFNGNYEGTGIYQIFALTLDQSEATTIVSLQESGSFDETCALEGGWYYIVVEKTDGTATLNWAAE